MTGPKETCSLAVISFGAGSVLEFSDRNSKQRKIPIELNMKIRIGTER